MVIITNPIPKHYVLGWDFPYSISTYVTVSVSVIEHFNIVSNVFGYCE